MVAITRLVTYADVDDWPDQPAGQVSFSAVLKVELGDGRELVLLDDRGWSQTALVEGGTAPPDQWRYVTRQDVEETARTVVGPDEPIEGESCEDAVRMHWLFLAGVLDGNGIPVSAEDLRSAPHAVVLSDRLLARIGGQPPT